MSERATLAGCVLALAACTAGTPPCRSGTITCEGNTAVSCVGGVERREPCTACVEGVGCRPCEPGSARCDGQRIERCVGGEWRLAAECAPIEGTICQRGECVRPCDEAAASHAYLGCEYWPVVTPNPAIGGGGDAYEAFDFAVVVSNPQAYPALVRIEGPESTVVDRRLEPGEVAAVPLPWVDALRRGESESGEYLSRIVDGGAYRVRSTAPIAAYSFNPLQFGGADCDAFTDPPCSFTNDSSLLLPTSALGDTYLLLGPTTHTQRDGPQAFADPPFVVVVGTREGTRVWLRSSAYLRDGPGLAAREPGEVLQLEIGAGDAALIFVDGREAHWSDLSKCRNGGGQVSALEICEASAAFDLTGSTLEASAPIAVFMGAPCHRVPHDVMACDTLVEQLAPLASWGRSAAAVPLNLSSAPGNVFRVVSGEDGNEVRFSPPVHAPVRLDRGRSVDILTGAGFVVEGTGRLQVAQYLVGQNFGDDPDAARGDPSLAFLAPREQYRLSYDVLAPSTYEQSWLLVLAPPDTRVVLDGEEVALPSVDGTEMFGRWIEVAAGAHRVTADRPFGVLLGGVASYTSYLMGGGLDVAPLLF